MGLSESGTSYLEIILIARCEIVQIAKKILSYP